MVCNKCYMLFNRYVRGLFGFSALLRNGRKCVPNLHLKDSKSGFTIIELMVVVSIMALLAGALVLNLAGQRAPRSLKIAQNEMVSNFRGTQSYTLSGRTFGVNESVQYYVLRFAANGTNYTIQAMYQNNIGIWKVSDIQTVNLPSGVTISDLNITAGGTSVSSSCALVFFQSPFAKIYLNNGCNPSPLPAKPYTITDADDYKKILNFITNAPGLTTSVNSKITITLKYQQESSTKAVIVNGATGLIDFQ
jgi:prepilin-type N-terminal cleavage/methylation domain-containing protein